MRSKKSLIVFGIFAGSIALSAAQTTAPNTAGVFAAHTHLNVTDLAASNAFWTAVGGVKAQIGSMNGVQMPGLYVLFQLPRGRGRRGPGRDAGSMMATNGAPNPSPGAPPSLATPAAPPESSVGSVVDAIGIKEKNLQETLAKLAALGVTPEPGATATSASVMSPERVRVVLTEDPSLTTSSRTNEWLMKVPNPAEAAAWYEKWLGATVVPQGRDVITEIPGMNLHFMRTASPLAGTRGRALDHIGFDVVELQPLLAKMQAEGVTVNSPYRAGGPGFLTAVSFVTDPWGTYIELNQGYDGH